MAKAAWDGVCRRESNVTIVDPDSIIEESNRVADLLQALDLAPSLRTATGLIGAAMGLLRSNRVGKQRLLRMVARIWDALDELDLERRRSPRSH